MTANYDLSISIAIINQEELQFVRDLLPAVQKAGGSFKIEVIIINNLVEGAEDLTALYTDLVLIHNEVKRPFTVNHNLGIAAARGRYILVLNPDIRFDDEEPCLFKMIRFMDENTGCGISGCRVYNFNNEFAFPARKYQTLPVIMARRLPFFYGAERITRNYLYQDRDIHSTFEADWLSGCFLMIRRSAVEEVGPMDENYIKYFEDVDICRRMHAFGWQVLYHGETFYYHLEKRASKKILSRDAVKHMRSWLRWKTRDRYYRRLEKSIKK